MAEGWEGKNVLAWVMDEASAFRTNSGGDNAEVVHKSLRSSATSRFGFMHWVGFIISFPRKQQGDFALNRHLAAESNPNIYDDRGATWEINLRWEKITVVEDSEEYHELVALKYRPIAGRVVGEDGLVTLGHPLYQEASDEFVLIEDLNVEVPKEMEEDFLTNGIDALTRYKAEPPLTEGGFFESAHDH